MTTTFDGLRDIIVRDFELPPERLRRETPLEEIELDSLAITELVFSLEDEFHVTAGNVNPAFKNLGDIADYIDQLIVERDAAPKAAKPKPARAAAPKSLPAARGRSAAAPRAPGSKSARSARDGAKSGERPRAAANGALRAKTGKAGSASATPSDAAARKRKRSSATAGAARTR